MPYFEALGRDNIPENNISEAEFATANLIKQLADTASLQEMAENLAGLDSPWFSTAFETHRARTKGCALYALREAYHYNNQLQADQFATLEQKQSTNALITKMAAVIKSPPAGKLSQARPLLDAIEAWIDQCSNNEQDKQLCKAFFIYAKALALKIESMPNSSWAIDAIAFNKAVSGENKQLLADQLSRISTKSMGVLSQPIRIQEQELRILRHSPAVTFTLDEMQEVPEGDNISDTSSELSATTEASASLKNTAQDQRELKLKISDFLDKKELFLTLSQFKLDQKPLITNQSLLSIHRKKSKQSTPPPDVDEKITQACKDIAQNDEVLFENLMHASTEEIQKITDQIGIVCELQNDHQFLQAFINEHQKSVNLKGRYLIAKMGVPYTLSAEERTMIEFRKEAKELSSKCTQLLHSSLESAIVINKLSTRGRLFELSLLLSKIEDFKTRLDEAHIAYTPPNTDMKPPQP